MRIRRKLLAPAVLALLTGCTVPIGSEGGTEKSHAPANASSPSGGPSKAQRTSPGVAGSRQARVHRGTALGQLATLQVKGRAPLTGYDRERFGSAWLDTDRNGCDTRNDILTRDLTRRRYDPATHGCVMTSGLLRDPYTKARIRFVKGNGDLVDIDHVVALGNAWVTGGFGWELRKRAAFANDPLNLLAVSASANRQKGDSDAATWLPSNKGHRCAYVARQITVKAKYGLWVTTPERDAMARVLATCPSQSTVPASGAPVIAPLKLSEPSDVTSEGGSPGADGSAEPTHDETIYYENCDQARAADAAPVHRGDSGYHTSLDGDGDGVACE